MVMRSLAIASGDEALSGCPAQLMVKTKQRQANPKNLLMASHRLRENPSQFIACNIPTIKHRCTDSVTRDACQHAPIILPRSRPWLISDASISSPAFPNLSRALPAGNFQSRHKNALAFKFALNLGNQLFDFQLGFAPGREAGNVRLQRRLAVKEGLDFPQDCLQSLR